MGLQERLAAAPGAVSEGRLEAMLLGAGYARDEAVTLPSGAVFEFTLRPVPLARKRALELEAQAHYRAQNVELTAATADAFESDSILRKLAYAVCDRGTDTPVDGYEAWRAAPEPLVAVIWRKLLDLEYEMDPLADAPDEETLLAIADAVKKNGQESLGYLMTFGSSTLAHYVISMALLRETSQPHSSPSGSSGETSSPSEHWTNPDEGIALR